MNNVCTIDIDGSNACIALIDDIGNGEDVKQRLTQGDLNATLINCKSVSSSDLSKLNDDDE